jgi:hypothetical protein
MLLWNRIVLEVLGGLAAKGELLKTTTNAEFTRLCDYTTHTPLHKSIHVHSVIAIFSSLTSVLNTGIAACLPTYQ